MGKPRGTQFLGPSTGSKKGREMFARVLYHGTVYQCGEDVVVLGDGPSTWVAEILTLFRDDQGEMCMDLRWYYRPEDLPKKLKDLALAAYPREIFYSDHCEAKQPISCLRHHAVVLSETQFRGLPVPPDDPNIFFVRHHLQATKAKISPLPLTFFPRKLPQTLGQIGDDDPLPPATPTRRRRGVKRSQPTVDEDNDNAEEEEEEEEPSRKPRKRTPTPRAKVASQPAPKPSAKTAKSSPRRKVASRR